MTTTTRPLNDDDRAFLKNGIQFSTQGSGPIEMVLMIIWYAILTTIGLWIVWISLIWVLRFVPAMALWASTTNTKDDVWFIACIAAVCALAYGVWYRTRVRTDGQTLLDQIQAELDHNEVEEEVVTVDAVKCFQEPEHFGLIYLLRLTDGRIRVCYDYDSFEYEGYGESIQTGFVIPHSFSMVHFKFVDAIRYEFGQTEIPKPTPKPINLDPEDWPEDETWLDISWGEIDAQYADHRS